MPTPPDYAPTFAYAHAAADPVASASATVDWGRLTLECVTQLGAAAQGAGLGFIYVTDALAPHLAQILALLRQSTGVRSWAGSVGMGILATGVEYFEQPAMAL